jgi:hypothetical protein
MYYFIKQFAVSVKVPIDGQELSRHDNVVQVESSKLAKKHVFGGRDG